MNTHGNTSDNLPIAITKVGGALELVVRDIESYTEPSFPLMPFAQIMLARIIEDRPELNTEPRVALLVDALAYHGVSQRKEFIELLDEYETEDVYLALDYLYEIGTRGRGKVDAKDENEKKARRMSKVGEVIDLIIRLRTFDFDVDGVGALDSLIFSLGGIKNAIGADDEKLQELYDERRSS